MSDTPKPADETGAETTTETDRSCSETGGCCRWSRVARVVGVLGLLGIAAVVIWQVAFSDAASNAESITERMNRNHAAAESGARPEEIPAEEAAQAEVHPLTPALAMAREALDRIESDVQDYTARIIKRERIGDTLGDEQQMEAKIRCRKLENGELVQPLSVYLKFVSPRSVAGREVIWVENQNNGQLVAHEGGLLGLVTVTLPPDGKLAMLGQRYPIYKIGVQNLIEELIVKGERDRKLGMCEVRTVEHDEVAGRDCRMLEVKHDDRKPEYDFHIARIWIDNELNLPIRYAAWAWPETPGGEPLLLEDYTYADLQVNVGLTDADFDRENSDYSFP
ncbi:MAG: DUF1571 domain-containing protein [Planctomycetales bacterium]|nr:DUF1571 domain-containing protein [Planctomycetales bacterium]